MSLHFAQRGLWQSPHECRLMQRAHSSPVQTLQVDQSHTEPIDARDPHSCSHVVGVTCYKAAAVLEHTVDAGSREPSSPFIQAHPKNRLEGQTIDRELRPSLL